MRKLVFILLFLMASNLFADTLIHCPAAPDDSLNGKQWNIRLREQYGTKNNTVDQYHPYDFINKKIEGDMYPGHIDALWFSYDDSNATAHSTLEDDKEITLTCTGTYGLSRQYILSPNENFTENFIATISVAHAYKACMSNRDNQSFTCMR